MKKKKELVHVQIHGYTIECEPKDIQKYEIADELGLLPRVADGGWKQLSAKEAGRIGGIISARRRNS